MRVHDAPPRPPAVRITTDLPQLVLMNEGDAERTPQRPCVICGLLPWGSRSAVSQPESAGVNYSYLIISYPDQTHRARPASERKGWTWSQRSGFLKPNVQLRE